MIIISPNEFQLLNAGGLYPSSGGVFGYLHAPPIASPALLATIVNAALNDVAPGEFQVSYSPTTGRFSFQYISASTSCIVGGSPSSHIPVTVSLRILTGNVIGALMGFGVGNIKWPFLLFH